MPTPLHDLEAKILRLQVEDRARLLDVLIASFGPPSPTRSAWMELALQREAGVKIGKTAMVPGSEALERIKARIS